ncbi:MAG: 6-carboxytetrahydropterin synthase QueD [Candidatus Omnitrophica bacterium]|nr:6-carboxytetrahydropterin synthase QueD [Candidatus Omnitrophota bacterium]HOX54017.1 6-carboxytetrahydropterin synthase QueD [Candidatus Omnitrophota bacterium]
MFEVRVESNFSSAHRLRGYKGKCEELHGHNWKVEAFIQSENLDKIGMVVDFHHLKNLLKSVLNKLDHKFLNDVDYFKKVNPTSENIAKYIYDQLRSKDKKLGLTKVTVWESDTSYASYIE